MDRNLGTSFEPRNGDLFAGISIDKIILINLDREGNRYFDVSHAWGDHFESQIDDESILIDPSLHVMTELPAPTTFGRIIITIPKQLTEISSKFLIYLTQIIDIPEVPKDSDEGSIGEVTSDTSEEMEDLESIVEGSPKPPIPSMIDDVSVNKDPRSMQIEDILDLRRIGSSRKTFYLVRMVDGIYY